MRHDFAPSWFGSMICRCGHDRGVCGWCVDWSIDTHGNTMGDPMNWKLSGAWAVVAVYGALFIWLFIWLLTLIPLWAWVVMGWTIGIPLSLYLIVWSSLYLIEWSWCYIESYYTRKT